LLIELLDDRRHFPEHGSRNHDEVRLPRRGAQHFGTETGDVVGRGEGGGHFDVAAGQPEVERPDGVLTAPADQLVQPRKQDVATDGLPTAGPPARTARRLAQGPVHEGCPAPGGGAGRFSPQSNAPMRHSYTSAAVRTNRKIMAAP